MHITADIVSTDYLPKLYSFSSPITHLGYIPGIGLRSEKVIGEIKYRNDSQHLNDKRLPVDVRAYQPIGKRVAKRLPVLYMPSATILDFCNSEVAPLDRPTPPKKTHPRTKHHVSMLYTARVMLVYKYLKTIAAVRHLVKGHPRSSTLVPIESPYATSY